MVNSRWSSSSTTTRTIWNLFQTTGIISRLKMSPSLRSVRRAVVGDVRSGLVYRVRRCLGWTIIRRGPWRQECYRDLRIRLNAPTNRRNFFAGPHETFIQRIYHLLTVFQSHRLRRSLQFSTHALATDCILSFCNQEVKFVAQGKYKISGNLFVGKSPKIYGF